MDEDTPSRGSRSPELEAGIVINGLYRLVRFLGEGGMGEVWEARHERTKGRVALKLLLPELSRHEGVLLRFQREVEITSGLNHPNIVRVSDADKLQNGWPFLVMEFLEGHDLSYVLQSGQPLTLDKTIEIVEQAAMGLQAAHDQSVIHRDLKPANIFIVPLPGMSRVLVKILDFGIPTALDGLSQLTHSRSVMGTPHYMAPEQATRGASSVDARADQFSLAAITYELLTGRMAFAGDGIVNVIFKVVNERPPSFFSCGLAMPAGVEAAVMRGLAKLPADRFGSVLEFSQELRRAAGYLGAERLTPSPEQVVLAAPSPLFPDIHPLTNTAVEFPSKGGTVGSLSTSLKTFDTRLWRSPSPAPQPQAPPVAPRHDSGDDSRAKQAAVDPTLRAAPEVASPSPSHRPARNRARLIVLVATGLVAGTVVAALLSRDHPLLSSAFIAPTAVPVATREPPPVAAPQVVPNTNNVATDEDGLARGYLDAAEKLAKDGHRDLARRTLAKASQLRIQKAELGVRMARLAKTLTVAEVPIRKSGGGATVTKVRPPAPPPPSQMAMKGKQSRPTEADSMGQTARPETMLAAVEPPDDTTAVIKSAEPTSNGPSERSPKVAPPLLSPRATGDSGPKVITAGAVPAALTGERTPPAATGTGLRARATVGPVLSAMPRSPVPKPRLPHSIDAETADEVARVCQLVEASTISTAGVSPEFAHGVTLPLRGALGGHGTVYPVGMYYFIIREASLKHDNRSAAQALARAQSDGLLLKLKDLPATDFAP